MSRSLEFIDEFSSGRWLEDFNVDKRHVQLPENMHERLHRHFCNAVRQSYLPDQWVDEALSACFEHRCPDPLGVLRLLEKRFHAGERLTRIDEFVAEITRSINEKLEYLLASRSGLAYRSLTGGLFEFYIGQYLSLKVYLDPEPPQALDMTAYLQRLAEDAEAYERFSAYALPSTTYFFRSGLQYDCVQAFRRLMTSGGVSGITDVLSGERRRPLEILVAGASTGAEAYTIAMIVAEQGVDANILAIDPNRAAIDYASRAHYSARQLTGIPDAFRSYVDGDTVRPNIASRVAFECMDIEETERRATATGVRFDLICFRNVMRYLTSDKAQRAREAIARLLAPGGLLLVEDVWHHSRTQQGEYVSAFRALTPRLLALNNRG